MKIDILRIESDLRPGLDDRPRIHGRQGPVAAVDLAEDETVIAIDRGLFDAPAGLAGARGRPGYFGRFGALVLPGYGLGRFLVDGALFGDRIGNIGTDRSLAGAQDGGTVGRDRGGAPRLVVHGRRLRLTGPDLEGLEAGEPGAARLDIMQVALGGAGFAEALQQSDRSRGAVPAATGLAAHLVSAAAHAMPSLRPLLPYARGVSIGLRIYRTLMDEAGRPARLDAVLI